MTDPLAELYILRATIEQQAAWLREVTQERDTLKLRVAELEQEVERVRTVQRHYEAKLAELENFVKAVHEACHLVEGR